MKKNDCSKKKASSKGSAPASLSCLLAALLLQFACAVCGDEDLRGRWRRARTDAYLAPTAAEIADAERVFAAELAGTPDTERAWRKLGFERTVLRLGGRDCAAAAEAPPARHGRGFYVFCHGAPLAMVLQVPHGWSDLHTGRIGIALAATGRLALAGFNTAPRHGPATDRDAAGADLAHLPESYFTAMTRAAASAAAIHRVVQLHGFASGKRRSLAAANADFIISAGHRDDPGDSARVAAALGAAFGVTALVYPRDTDELGATTNRQAAVLRALGADLFVHLEVGLRMRERLRDDAAARGKLLEAIAP